MLWKVKMSKLALLGGDKSVISEPADMFKWPIVNAVMENAICEVLRDGNMSGTDITKQFEHAFAEWLGVKYALGHCNGTAALLCAMYGAGLGTGDELICPSITYWASCAQALSLGAKVVFADIDPVTLCLDPNDIEHRITPRTKAIMVVHYLAMPADMDAIMTIARKHGLKVIEDVSHAHGALYKNKMVGTFGDVAGYSLMSGKSFAIGEGGMLTTDNREIYERAIAFGHHERHSEITNAELKSGKGVPRGGLKGRMHQMSAAVGLEQLKKYPAEIAEIDKAMNYFWDLLEDVPGLGSHRPDITSGTTKGGWYCCHGQYRAEEFGGLSLSRFSEAVRAEGGICSPGCNAALHLHPLFNDIDVSKSGTPTNLTPGGKQNKPVLPVSEGIQARVFKIPWFKHFRPEIIEQHAAAYRKTAKNYRDLLPGDNNREEITGQWALSARKN